MAGKMKLTEAQYELLRTLTNSEGYVACDGKDRAVAHELEATGFVDWKGSSWGSQFWAVTDAGRDHLASLFTTGKPKP